MILTPKKNKIKMSPLQLENDTAIITQEKANIFTGSTNKMTRHRHNT